MRSSNHNQRVVVAVVYVLAMFMATMDTTIVNVALPTIGRTFHTSAASVDLVSIAFLVSLAVFIPVSGWWGDRVGGRRALLGAVGVFTVASALCGLATDLPELVVFRVLQGVGGGMMTPVGLSMLFRVYPPSERVRVSSILILPAGLAPAVGPVLGGLFTTDLTWRLAFLVNVPVGAGAFMFGWLFLDGHHQPHPGRLDRRGFVLAGAGLGSAMLGLSIGPVDGWSSPGVIAALVVGLALLALLVPTELRTERPLIDLRLLGDRLFAASTSLYGLASVAYLGGLYLAALFLQDSLHLDALQSGLATFPSALGIMAGGQLVTRVLYPRFGPRRVIATGLGVVAATMLGLSTVGPDTDLWLIRLLMLTLGIGTSLVFLPAQAASMATVDKSRTGQASAVFNAGKQLGGAVGVALLTTVTAAAGGTAGSGVIGQGAFHDGFLAAAAVVVLAEVVAFRVRDADAASTMSGRPPKATRRSAGRRHVTAGA